MESEQIESLSIHDAMRIAAELHRGRNIEAAQTIYERVLAIDPDYPDALHFLGILKHQLGRREDAIRLITRSIELVPGHAGFHSNLGNLMFSYERFEEAEREYRSALGLDPDRVEILNNYALLCKGLKRFEESERCFRKAIELAPDYCDARNNLANLLTRLGRIEESIEQACEALVRNPSSSGARHQLATAYRLLGRIGDAVNIYKDWLVLEPDNPKARHHLAALTGEDVPLRANDVYVQQVFDTFAESFDAQLAKLEYRAPQLVGEKAAEYLGTAGNSFDVLDAGCGTGLCAAYLKPYARSLVGVDLSAGMLGKAAGRDLYDDLKQAELTAFMQTHPCAFDLIVSADTLVYFGSLAEAMQAAAGALRAGGLLCFTVEAATDEPAVGYVLQPHGRYAHGQPYLREMLDAAGLAVQSIDQVGLRNEGGKLVLGWLVLAARLDR